MDDKNNSIFLCYSGSTQSRSKSTSLDMFQTSSISDKIIVCQEINCSEENN